MCASYKAAVRKALTLLIATVTGQPSKISSTFQPLDCREVVDLLVKKAAGQKALHHVC